MFQSSNKIDKRLTAEVEQIESSPGYQILSAKLFWTPQLTFAVDCEVLHPRHISLLEEFVLRAAIELKNSPVTWEELSELLSVDKRFIKRTVDNLTQLANALKPSSDVLVATETGIEFYTKGQVPQPPQIITVRLAFIPSLSNPVMISPRKKSDARAKIDVEDVTCLPGIADVDKTLLDEITQKIDTQLLIETTAQAKDPIHNPHEGYTLHDIVSHVFEEKTKTYWGILVVRDAVDNSIFIQVRNWNNQSITPLHISQMQSEINRLIDQNVIQLLDLMQMEQIELDELIRITSDMVEGVISDEESRAPAVEKLVQSEVLEIRSQSIPETQEVKQHKGTAELVRDKDIRPSFINALEQAKERALIVSPWMTEQAVDEKLINLFKQLAQRRVVILLGWGIAKKIEDEDKPPPAVLMDRLSKILTPEGFPAVAVVWLGNQHSKDVIIDGEIHMCGSHNWLSYRGDFQPRGESIYRVTIPEQVQRAAGTIEGLFLKQILEGWDNGIKPTDELFREDALLPFLTAWIGIGKFDMAFQAAVDLAASHSRIGLLLILVVAASEHLVGMSAQTRSWLLHTLGSLWTDIEMRNIHKALPDFEHLSDRLRYLLSRMVQQQEDDVRSILSMYSSVWLETYVLQSDETIDEFIAAAHTRFSATAEKSIVQVERKAKKKKSKR